MILAALFSSAFLTLSCPQAEFSFEDSTVDVKLRDTSSLIINSRYTSQTQDSHIIGGSFVDLNGDGFPELILPAQRNVGFPHLQDEGGFLILANLPDPQNPQVRIFDNSPLEHAPSNPNFFDTPFPGSRAHEVQGILAGDYNNDGKLDLLIVCGGEYKATPGSPTDMSIFEGVVGADSPVDKPLRNLLYINMTETEAEVLGGGGTFNPAEFSFGLVNYGDTDPNANGAFQAFDGHGIQYTQEPSSVIPAYQTTPSQPEDFDVHGILVRDKTIFPTHSSVAAASDMNRDGRLDLFIGSHHSGGGAGGGYRSGQMNGLYLNVGNVGKVVTKYTVINGALQGGGVSVSALVPQFVDITYDRNNYPEAFPPPPGGQPVISTDLIAWQDYLPLFGLQGRCNCRDSYLIPCSDPIKRFSALNSVVFTDVNNDNWPDMILGNKGFGASSFFGPIHSEFPGVGGLFPSYKWMDPDSIYINRGSRLNPATGIYEWLGYWNRGWDLLESSPTPYQTNAPMGIAVADYDMDGDMDFYLSDVSFDLGEIEDLYQLVGDQHMSMGGWFFRNETQVAEGQFEQTDIAFQFSGGDLVEPNGAGGGQLDLRGTSVTPMWFGWGGAFGDFDMDGDMDLYAGAHGDLGRPDGDRFLEAIFSGSPAFTDPISGLLVPMEAMWDRVFENTRAGTDAATFNSSGHIQMVDYNPAEAHAPLLDFPNNYLAPEITRRNVTTNVLSGDYDQDGFIDLVVLPGSSSANGLRSMQVFHGLGNTQGAPNGRLTIRLDGGTSCASCTQHAIGAKVMLTAWLDGTTPMTQTRELRIGGANGATTDSLPLEFGVGLHPVGTSIGYTVLWPCGSEESGTLTGSATITHTTCPPPIAWDVFVAVPPFQPFDVSDATVPIQVMAQLSVSGGGGLEALGIAASELSMRNSGSGDSFFPVGMDHLFTDFTGSQSGPLGLPQGGYFRFDVTPIRYPVDLDAQGFPIATDYDLRVRSWNRALDSSEADSSTGLGPITIIPELNDTDFGNPIWSRVNTSDPGAGIGTVLEIDPGNGTGPGRVWKDFGFPADTDFSEYYIVYDVLVSPGNVGSTHEISLSCPDNPSIGDVVATFTDSGRIMVVLDGVPPFERSTLLELAIVNSGSIDFVLNSVERSHAPALCAN
ncbi:MAG: hypothetical protein QM477_01330 [Planctomycetota bacterium]